MYWVPCLRPWPAPSSALGVLGPRWRPENPAKAFIALVPGDCTVTICKDFQLALQARVECSGSPCIISAFPYTALLQLHVSQEFAIRKEAPWRRKWWLISPPFLSHTKTIVRIFFFFNQGVYGWILQDCVLVEIVRKVILHIQFSMKMVHHFHSILKGVSGLIVLHRLSTVMGFW